MATILEHIVPGSTVKSDSTIPASFASFNATQCTIILHLGKDTSSMLSSNASKSISPTGNTVSLTKTFCFFCSSTTVCSVVTRLTCSSLTATTPKNAIPKIKQTIRKEENILSPFVWSTLHTLIPFVSKKPIPKQRNVPIKKKHITEA